MHVIRHRDLGHAQKIILDHLQRRRTGIAGNIVRTTHDVDHSRPQCDNVLTKTQEHLRRCLAADAAADTPRREEFRRFRQPAFRNGISEKNGIDRYAAGSELGVLVGIATEIRPIGMQPLFIRRISGTRRRERGRPQACAHSQHHESAIAGYFHRKVFT